MRCTNDKSKRAHQPSRGLFTNGIAFFKKIRGAIPEYLYRYFNKYC
ncbi:hypothetical protein LALCM10_50040 [Dellaglioa algida]|nr:hypothetical protein LALCM10_50040 [Dellaglioa algida]